MERVQTPDTPACIQTYPSFLDVGIGLVVEQNLNHLEEAHFGTAVQGRFLRSVRARR